MKSYHLLIVDDDQNITMMISRFLKTGAWNITAESVACHSMDDALAFLRTGASVDVILLDLVMPPLRAEDVMAMIPKLREYCDRVVVISGYESYRDASIAAGATGFISKLGGLDSGKNFWEKLAGFFREMKGPTETEREIAKLDAIPPPKSTDAT